MSEDITHIIQDSVSTQLFISLVNQLHTLAKIHSHHQADYGHKRRKNWHSYVGFRSRT